MREGKENMIENNSTEVKTDKHSIKKDLCIKKFESEIDDVFNAYVEFQDKIKDLVIGPSVINSTKDMVDFCNNLQTIMLNDIENQSEQIATRKKTIIDAYFKRYKNEIFVNNKSIGAVVRSNESSDM